ncbi:MAG: cysteine-rich CWC family protein [Lentimicrobiaceae bacterium]|nr:cysteine-rich CWC family protein [Lentimicrobiaceae bacterium]
MSEPSKPTQKICPRCGLPFECEHSASCWCNAYTLSPANTEKLRNEFDNCLCPQCLQLYANPVKDTN